MAVNVRNYSCITDKGRINTSSTVFSWLHDYMAQEGTIEWILELKFMLEISVIVMFAWIFLLNVCAGALS